MTIAVSGATGQLGRFVVDRLKIKPAIPHIVALVRSLERVADSGVATRAADDSCSERLGASLGRVATLRLTCEIGKRALQHVNVIAVSKPRGVKRMFYTSLLRANNSPLNLAVGHLEGEEALVQWRMERMKSYFDPVMYFPHKPHVETAWRRRSPDSAKAVWSWSLTTIRLPSTISSTLLTSYRRALVRARDDPASR
ncbi:NmrA family NAD(P)-binding protein [Pseudomonas fluorescens]|uniref:NmrA family NAD(P)-binding protein n=1 Tax=Pseudomonas fluorescens TaxID=294 RepID=UPI003C14C491